MKNRLDKYLVLIIIAVVFVSCYDTDGRERLARAQTLLEQDYADSAANALDSIYLPRDMGRDYSMQYLVTRVQARYKAYREVKNDTAVLEAVEYFERKSKNPTQIAVANYSAGVVFIEQGDYQRALTYLKRAAEVAENTKNYKLQGLIFSNIGYLYNLQLLNKEAVLNYRQAYNSYLKSSNIENQLQSLNSIATNFLIQNQLDSALSYYAVAESKAVESNNYYFQATIFINRSIIFRERGQYKLALRELNKITDLPLDTVLRNKQNLNLAKSYYQLGQNDSLKIYMDKLTASLAFSADSYYKASVYSFLSELENSRNNYQKAMEYLELRNENALAILEQNQSRALIETEKKYDYTYHKNQAERAIHTNRQLLLFFIIAGLLFVLFFVWWTERQKRKRLQTESGEKIMEYRQQQQELENRLLHTQIDHFGYNNATLRQIVEQVNSLHAAIQDKAQAGLFHEKSERYQEIQQVIKETKTIVQKNTGESSKLFLVRQQLLPEEVVNKLSADDAVIISMIYSGEERKNIATTLSVSAQAVYNRIPRLRERLRNYGVPIEKIALLFRNLDK